jgi:hypothetical protein
MKKLFYLAVAALLAMNVTFTSCSKDDDDPTTPDSLSGTVWGLSAGSNSVTISFTSGMMYELSISGPDLDDFSGVGLYSYSKPDLILYDGDDQIHGTVNGNKLTLSVEGEEIILTKK